MTPEDTTPTPARRHILRALAALAVAVVLLALVARVIWGVLEARRLDDQIDRIHAAGLPMTFEQLEAAIPEPPPADDAAPLYESAFTLIAKLDPNALDKTWQAYRTALDASPASRPADQTAGDANRLLANAASALDLLDRAAQRPGCSYTVGLDHGIQSCLPGLSRVRSTVKLLSLRALVLASKDHGDQAVNSVISLLQCRRVLRRQPAVLCSLVEIVLVNMAVRDAARTLEIAHPSDPALTRLQHALLAADQPRPLERMMIGEQVYCLQMMRDLIPDGEAAKMLKATGAALPERWPPGGWFRRPRMQHEAAGMLRDSTEWIRIARLPLPEAMEALRAGAPATSHLGRVTAPSLLRASEMVARSVAELRSAAVAVAIERYRRAHAAVPASLTALVPDVIASLPKDPYTGNDLSYRHTADRFVVYSVAENLKDDGGDLKRKGDEYPPELPDFGVEIRLKPLAPTTHATSRATGEHRP
jgi:hypothetical protein